MSTMGDPVFVKKKHTIAYLGQNGFPFGMAAIQRQLQIAKAIVNEHTDVLVISRKGTHSPRRIHEEGITTSGTFEGVAYVYASGTPLYPNNFLVRNFLKIFGVLGELAILLRCYLTKGLTGVVVCTSKLPMLRYLWFLTRILRIKLIYDYVEFFSSLADRSIKEVTDKKGFDMEFFKYADAFIVISTYLANHLRAHTTKPFVVVPPIIDFEKFTRVDTTQPESEYFLYCGSVDYKDVIEFIIAAYYKTDAQSKNVRLVLIIYGDKKEISEIQRSVERDSSIKILSGLSYETLIGYYKNAKALLIPLQDNLQDRARFPFKISEYTAAGRPIVTSDSGAIVEYFQHEKNALLARTGDLSDFAAKLNFVLHNPQKSTEIGLNGNLLGRQHFNYKSYRAQLLDLISNEGKQGGRAKERHPGAEVSK
jgi:glycosyltransferase involved in cell wall biosynthesis